MKGVDRHTALTGESGPVTSDQASVTCHRRAQVGAEEKARPLLTGLMSGCQCWPAELSRIMEMFCLFHSVGGHCPGVAMECLKMCGGSQVSIV